MKNQDYKNSALDALKGSWPESIVTAIVYFAIAAVCTAPSALQGNGSDLLWVSPVLFIVLGQLLMGIFIFLWSLLLIVPGIIKAYSYAMTPYILVDRPELSVRDAIRLSGRMMSGRKLDLFCLHLSFIGWMLLCILTLGIGILFLSPYMMTAQAAFYQDVRSDYEMKTAEAGL